MERRRRLAGFRRLRSIAVRAPLPNWAPRTPGNTRQTNGSAVLKKQAVGAYPPIPREDLLKLALGLVWCFRGHPSKPIRNPVAMDINTNCGFLKRVNQYAVRCLAPDARKRQQCLNVVRHLPAVLIHQNIGKLYQARRFRFRIQAAGENRHQIARGCLG